VEWLGPPAAPLVEPSVAIVVLLQVREPVWSPRTYYNVFSAKSVETPEVKRTHDRKRNAYNTPCSNLHRRDLCLVLI
jgi:hypothetical protein